MKSLCVCARSAAFQDPCGRTEKTSCPNNERKRPTIHSSVQRGFTLYYLYAIVSIIL